MNKKGFTFTYDISLAFVILMIMMTASTFYASNAPENKLTNVHVVSAASDLMNVMIRDGTLGSLNNATINSEIQKYLPSKYDIELNVIVNDGRVVEINKTLPSDRFMGTGKMYFVTYDNQPARVDFKIWQKG